MLEDGGRLILSEGEGEYCMSKSVEQAYEAIRLEILSGALKPGERLREEDLVKRAGVSRTPIREALRRLEADGYAVVEANRGATVAAHSKRDVDEIYGLRALLEGHAARRAATRITSAQLDHMSTLNAQIEALGQRTDLSDNQKQLARIDLNQAFHQVVLDACDNARLAALVRQLAHVALSAQTFAHYQPKDLVRSSDHHEELIRALRSGHPDWSEATMRSHVHNARQVMTLLADINADTPNSPKADDPS
jgi:DNA-binding GntR family transcriptional regulator